jgi:hypothetical protein
MKQRASFSHATVLGLCLLIAGTQGFSASEKGEQPSTESATKSEQEIINLSKDKWQWMSERKVDSLEALFHEEAVFVHMGDDVQKAGT